MTAAAGRRASVGPEAIRAVLRHPELWITALRQLRRTARRGWWRSTPFLPLPDPDYLEFRMLTQYGDPAHDVDGADVLNYLRWCNQWERTTEP